MMWFAPAWLGLFVPFAALAWWTLRRPPTTWPTTSAFLWPTRSLASSARDRRLPPAWTIAALASIACAILALAGPARQDRAQVSVVIDPTYRVGVNTAAAVLATLARGGMESSVVVPGQPDATTLDAVRPTARSTGDAVLATVARLRREARDVIVVSDAAVTTEEHVRIVAPTAPSVNASVERIGARSSGGAVAVFVRVVRTIGSPSTATLSVRSGDAVVKEAIVWQGDQTSVDAFVHLRRAGDVIEARVAMAGDGVPLDDVARLTRDASSNVRLVVDGAMPASIDRFAAAYARVHRVDDAMPTTSVTLTSDAATAGPAVVVADGGAPMTGGVARHTDDAILADVDLDALAASATTMPTGFEAIAWRGERPIVATRDVGGRHVVWLALDVEAAAREPAFVVLLDQAIAWAAGATDEAWSAVTTDAIPLVGWHAATVDGARVDASPGVYVDAEGRRRAANLPAVAAASRIAGAGDLAAWLASRHGRAATPLATWPIVAAGAFAAIAAALAGGPRARRRYLDVRAPAT